MDTAMVQEVAVEQVETASDVGETEQAAPAIGEVEPVAPDTDLVEPVQSSHSEVAQGESHPEQAEPVVPAWRGASSADKLAYAAQLLGVDADTLLEQLLARQEGAADGWQNFSQQMAAKADEALTARLAEEFEQLCQMVPEVTSIDQLPPSVWEAAVEQGVPLTDAYLRFWYREQQKAAAEAKRQQQNAASSAGSLSGVYQPPQVEQEAFNRAFWG